MNIKENIQQKISKVIEKLYQVEGIALEVQENKTDFEGDFTIVIFPLVKQLKKSPNVLGEELGEELLKMVDFVEKYNVVKGFLNISVRSTLFFEIFKATQENFGKIEQKNKKVMVEYSSPNTNKPLHLGHIRNILLGYSVSQILQEAGYEVVKTQIVNDRGIHICKSMLAWEKFGNGETPATSGLKGDKLVGNYYVKFDQEYKKEIETLKQEGLSEEEAKKQVSLFLEAQKMLLDWEKEDPKVRRLWEMMNQWVYAGFAETYKRLGVDFDQIQYESDTYLLGKNLIQEGVAKGVFYQKEDGSVWCDLTDEVVPRCI